MQRDDFRADLPVSRGQWRALALVALDHIGESAPGSRVEATELLVRFCRTVEDGQPAANGAGASVGGAG